MSRRIYLPKQYRCKFELDQDVAITHTSYALYYHAAWATKNRLAFISGSMRNELKRIFYRKAREIEVKLFAVEFNPEHGHVVFGTKPLHYIPEIFKKPKGASSRLITRKGEEVLQWRRGYDIRTVSKSNLWKAIQQFSIFEIGKNTMRRANRGDSIRP
jgi:REP element-mobilizing transposase RayT